MQLLSAITTHGSENITGQALEKEGALKKVDVARDDAVE